MTEPETTCKGFEVNHLVKQYANADKPVLDDISFKVKHGSVLVVLGPSGSGKSTLLRTIAGLEPIQGGTISINNQVIDAGKPGTERAGRSDRSSELRTRIGMVFQEPEHQFAASTVRDEVAIGPKSMGKTDEEAYSIADRLLERLNLSRFAKANPFTLSGGEKRRLSVASMLAAAPKVLVMDEPTFGQDFTTWTSMVQLIAGARDQGCAVIMITHDEPLIEALGARRILVREGE